MAVTHDSALAWRMQRHFLGAQRARSVEDVIGRLVAVPSWSGDAELAVGLRLERPEPGAVAAAFEQRRIIRTFAFRGAMSYFTPEGAGVHLALRAIGRQWELPSWREHYRLAPEDWPDLRAAVRDALAAGGLTPQELAAAVTAHPRFAHLDAALTSFTFLKPFAWQGDLSLGPSRDGEIVLQSLADVPGWEGIPPVDEAGPRAIEAYLAAYGPATEANVQYWLGEGLSAGKKNISRWIGELRRERVVTLDLDGVERLCLVEHVDVIAATTASDDIHLLPGLDQWVLGPGTADPRVVPAADRAGVTRGANLVIVGGRVVGTWKLTKDAIGVTPFDDRTLPTGELTAAVARVSNVLDRPVTLTA